MIVLLYLFSFAYTQLRIMQLGVHDRESIMTLQDGSVGFDTMLIGFFTKFLSPPKLSCSTDQTYKYLGGQLWVVLSSEESKYHGDQGRFYKRKQEGAQEKIKPGALASPAKFC